MRYLLKIFLLTLPLFGSNTIETDNTNILSKTNGGSLSNYNRFRIYGTFDHDSYSDILLKVIVDNENRYNISKTNNKNSTDIYRAYLKYADETSLIVIGKQRIPFGVGRIWNPTDIFNPIDAAAIETDQRIGTDSIRYEYALSELSNIDMTVSKDKYAFRIKGYLAYADTALIALKDNKNDTKTFGYEFAGELFETNIEFRSEGGYKLVKEGKDYYELIAGIDYSFENSLSLLGEYRYDDLLSQDQFASTISYELTTLSKINFLGIKNIDDKSTLLSVRFDYSVADDITFDTGVYLYRGNKFTRYGDMDNSFFAKLYIHF